MITMDKDGNIWEAMMGQAQIAKLDPKTEKVSIYLAPDWNKGRHAVHDDRRPAFGRRREIVDQDQWRPRSRVTPTSSISSTSPPNNSTKSCRRPESATLPAYGLVTDLDNNVYGLDNNPDQRQIWRTDAKTGETNYIDLPPGVGGARRGHIDSRNRLWFSQFHANRYAMYDPKSGKITQWEVPVPYAGAYDVQFDDADMRGAPI